jgi:hypothetical protein
MWELGEAKSFDVAKGSTLPNQYTLAFAEEDILIFLVLYIEINYLFFRR